MPVVRIHRYLVDPANSDEFLQRRAAVIAAIRTEHPGLSEARLIRLQDDTLMDVWRWDSAEQMQTALKAAPTYGQAAGAAISLTADATDEDGEIIDER